MRIEAASGSVSPSSANVPIMTRRMRSRVSPDASVTAHGADALIVMTEWLVYRNPDFERVRKLVRRPLLIDGRNLYDPERMASLGFEYHGIGRARR